MQQEGIMRKLIASEFVSLDNFFTDPKGNNRFRREDDELTTDTDAVLAAADAILLDGATYDILGNYWPNTTLKDLIIADKVNEIPKFIFSRTLDKVKWGKWNNATLVKDDLAQAIKQLKQQPGKDMLIFGSGELISTLAPLGLIDEYRLIVIPVVIGRGTPLFEGVTQPINLELLRTKTYQSGVIVLTYGSQVS
jgi:dihydrofolate reductase